MFPQRCALKTRFTETCCSRNGAGGQLTANPFGNSHSQDERGRGTGGAPAELTNIQPVPGTQRGHYRVWMEGWRQRLGDTQMEGGRVVG